MLKTSAVPFAIALMAGLAAAPSSARAGTEYPWCAVYSEHIVGATNCGFVSQAQCRAAISGVGGMCERNPAYVIAAPRKPRRH